MSALASRSKRETAAKCYRKNEPGTDPEREKSPGSPNEPEARLKQITPSRAVFWTNLKRSLDQPKTPFQNGPSPRLPHPYQQHTMLMNLAQPGPRRHGFSQSRWHFNRPLGMASIHRDPTATTKKCKIEQADRLESPHVEEWACQLGGRPCRISLPYQFDRHHVGFKKST